MTTKQPPLNVDKLQAPMRATHASGVNLTYEWRMTQLKVLQKMLVDNTPKMREAVSLDLGRDPCESIAAETKPMELDLKYVMGNLHKWMRPQAVPSPAAMIPAFSYLEPKPLESPGVLIIGPFNFPINCVLRPLIGVLAGGNPAVLKPSENCPHVAKLMKEMIEECFEPGVVQVVLGAVAETTALLEKSWSKVMFTGSERVGKIVAKACAETTTPTILELGGKCPVVVDETVSSFDLQNVADRIIFAKCMNAGQACIAPDTLFVHEKHVDKLSQCLVKAIEEQFGVDPKKGELSRIVNTAGTRRVVELIQDAEEKGVKVLFGGSKRCDVDSLYICPTLLLNPPIACRIRNEEVFGCVLPIVSFASREEGIELVQAMPGTPLELYVFTPKFQIFQSYTDRCRSAGGLQNDCVIQASSAHLPLGGLGSSGYGNYHGKFSFDAFTHVFPRAHRPIGKIWDSGNLRCHPYAGSKGKLLEAAMRAPDIPVLHTRKVLIGMVVFVLALAAPREARLLLASGLEVVVEWLRN